MLTLPVTGVLTLVALISGLATIHCVIVIATDEAIAELHTPLVTTAL